MFRKYLSLPTSNSIKWIIAGLTCGGVAVTTTAHDAVAGRTPLYHCGDGLVTSGEQCDDGNGLNGDGCEVDCTFTPPSQCPNGSGCVFKMMQSTTCQGNRQNAGTDLSQTTTLNNEGTDTRGIICWVDSDNRLRHVDARRIFADGLAGSGTYSKACVKDWHSGTSSCGLPADWSSEDAGSGIIDTVPWNSNGSWFPYVYTRLGANGRLRGITFSN